MKSGIFPPPHVEADKGHGRIETRALQTSTTLTGYIKFPHAQQVFRIRRVTTDLKGNLLRSEVVYGITSLSVDEASPQRVAELVRGHWSIENSLHWVRDVTFDEDRSQVRTGSGPRMMATLRNLVISILRLRGVKNIARAVRQIAWKAGAALRLIGL